MESFMKNPNKLFWLSLLFCLSLACNLISGLSQNIEAAKSTVSGIATQVLKEQEPLATARAIATELAASHLAETAKALVTEVSQSGAVETLQALATAQGPTLNETMQAFLTQEAPAIKETAQAYLTRVPPISPLPPSDIPLLEGEKENLIITENTISYLIALSYQQVLSFYKEKMPQNGWTYQTSSSIESENSAILNYTKENRAVTISINSNPANEKTIVVITIENP